MANICAGVQLQAWPPLRPSPLLLRSRLCVNDVLQPFGTGSYAACNTACRTSTDGTDDLLQPSDLRDSFASPPAGGGGGHGDPAALTALVGRDRAALEAMLDLIRCAPPVTVSCLSGPPAPVEAPPVGESAKDSASPYPASSTRQAPPSHLSSTDRSPDADAAAMGVQFTEMVLRVMPEGPAAVEAADGIDALESLHFRCWSLVFPLAA